MMAIDDIFRDIFDNPTTNGTPLMPFTDWTVAYAREPVDSIVDGLIFPGRWTALVAPAKTGKSTLALHLGQRLSRGLDPFTPARQTPMPVMYLDGEMGEVDTIERLVALELEPADLTMFHYTDLFPKGDTLQGGTAIVSTAQALCAGVVVLDGLNAFITGAEKDDAPWRALFEHTIAPLKRAGIAVVSSDNTGKDVTLSARGSSAKLDKADAIVILKRTDDGINLNVTHRRTSSYTPSLDLAIRGLEGEQPINFYTTHSSWPTGTAEAAAILDTLGIPLDWGRGRASPVLRAAGKGMRNTVLSAALKYRKNVGDRYGDRSLIHSGDSSPGQELF